MGGIAWSYSVFFYHIDWFQNGHKQSTVHFATKAGIIFLLCYFGCWSVPMQFSWKTIFLLVDCRYVIVMLYNQDIHYKINRWSSVSLFAMC